MHPPKDPPPITVVTQIPDITPPPTPEAIETEDEDFITTEDGDTLVTE